MDNFSITFSIMQGFEAVILVILRGLSMWVWISEGVVDNVDRLWISESELSSVRMSIESGVGVVILVIHTAYYNYYSN